MKRRNFIKTSLVAGAGLTAPSFLTKLMAGPDTTATATPATADPAATLPWQREIHLRDAANQRYLKTP